MEWIIYTILAVVILAAAVVCVCVFAKTRRDFSRNDVHINGGADIQTGRVSRDQNYFKGIKQESSAELLLWKAVVPKAEDSLLKL